MVLAVVAHDQRLPQRTGCLVDERDRRRTGTHRDELQPAALRMIDDLGRARIAGPHHRSPARVDDLIEQSHLGGEIGIHVGMIIEMVAAEIGEGGGRHRKPFGAILVKPVG